MRGVQEESVAGGGSSRERELAAQAESLVESPTLKAALDTWGEVTFDYASTDTLDFVPTPTAA